MSSANLVAYFHPSHWGNYFLDFVPYNEVKQDEKRQELEKLKDDVKKELHSTCNKPLAHLDLIDAIERLGLAYHFEEDIEKALQQFYESYDEQCDKDDLYHVSTRFRILRQHGFRIPCGVFEKFKDEEGSFKGLILNDDMRGILSLYEASHVRIHGDDILDEAFAFTKAYLIKYMQLDKLTLSSPLADQVAHALHQSLHQGVVRLESRIYISFYEEYASHNETLLKFSKLDFNILQALHQQEISEVSRWWKDLYTKVPFTRDRLVEAYFWVIGTYHEPKYSHARKVFIKIFMIMQVFDDIFDAYGTYDILKTLVEAVNRWDYSYVAQLPKYFNSCYQVLLETLDEVEKELAKEGRSYGIQHFKEQLNRCCEAWIKEAKWCKTKYIPTYEEYMEVAIISIGDILGFFGSFFGMGSETTKEAFDYVCQDPMPKLVESAIVIFRLMNDLASTEVEQVSREHVVSSIQCYMRENYLEKEQVYEAIEKQVENAWKELNEAMLRPYVIPKPLLDRILHITRATDVFYKGRTDGYTLVNPIIKNKISLVLVQPFLI